MAATLKSTQAGARRNFLSSTGLRYAGFLTAFVGILILTTGTSSIVSTIITITSILLALVGVLMISGNLKIILKNKKDKDALAYLLLGVLILIAGVLLYFFGGSIAGFTNLIIGILIAVYAVIALIVFVSNKKKTWHIILAAILFAAGVCVLLLYWVSAPVFVTITGILATVIGLTDLVLY